MDEPVIRERQRCSIPPVRYSPAAGEAEKKNSRREEAEDGGSESGSDRRTNKKRQTESPSPGSSGRQGTVQQPAVWKTRGRPSSLSPPFCRMSFRSIYIWKNARLRTGRIHP